MHRCHSPLLSPTSHTLNFPLLIWHIDLSSMLCAELVSGQRLVQILPSQCLALELLLPLAGQNPEHTLVIAHLSTDPH